MINDFYSTSDVFIFSPAVHEVLCTLDHMVNLNLSELFKVCLHTNNLLHHLAVDVDLEFFL